LYRLLIVDDEDIIVNGLHEIFSCMKNLDLDVYKAYSGEEAIEWLHRTRIDIVITDIRMPGIDGMQLLEEIRKNWPGCRVIFLSGYDEFTYVYRAIQHSGVSYILKTEDHDKVIEAVENAVREIQREIKTEDLIRKAKEQINTAHDLFQSDYLLHLLHGDATFVIDKAQFDSLSIAMHPDEPVLLLLGQTDGLSCGMPYSDRMQYLYAIRLVIAQYLGANIRSVTLMDENHRFVLFIQPRELSGTGLNQPEALRQMYDKTASFLKGMLEAVQTACRTSIGASISFVLSGEPCTWQDASGKYYDLVELLSYRIGSDIEMLLIDTEFKNNILGITSAPDVLGLEPDMESLETLLRQKGQDALEMYLESGQREKFYDKLVEFTQPMKTVKSKNNNLVIEAYSRISLCLLSYINRWKLTEKVAFCIAQNQLMRFDMFDSWEEATRYLYDLSEILFDMRSEEQQNRADKAIEYVQKFVEAHLAEDLSLVRLAEQVYLNPSYLSRLFKQMKGINLSDFIESERIMHAKELLERQNVKIYEVARQVGYETAASFTRFFKKAARLSPQEYRDAFLSSKNKTTK